MKLKGLISAELTGPVLFLLIVQKSLPAGERDREYPLVGPPPR